MIKLSFLNFHNLIIYEESVAIAQSAVVTFFLKPFLRPIGSSPNKKQYLCGRNLNQFNYE